MFVFAFVSLNGFLLLQYTESANSLCFTNFKKSNLIKSRGGQSAALKLAFAALGRFCHLKKHCKNNINGKFSINV
jgi:hypothetical protein